jgi:hypothetical protein
MKRQILGVLAASAAAPFLGAVSLYATVILISLNSSGLPSLGDFAEALMAVLFIGFAGIVVYGIPLLLASSIAAPVVSGFSTRSAALAIGIGAVIGLRFGVYITPLTSRVIGL